MNPFHLTTIDKINNFFDDKNQKIKLTEMHRLFIKEPTENVENIFRLIC